MKRIFLPVLLLLISGCTTYGQLQTWDEQPAQSSFTDGAEYLTSSVNESAVVVSPLYKTFASDGRMEFAVAVKNFGPEPIEISPANFSTIPEEHVFTYEELMKEEKKRLARQQFAIAMQAVGDSMQDSQAGYSSTSGNVGGTGFNATTYDQGAVQEAQARSQARRDAQMDQAKANSAAKQEQISGLLKRNTVYPGEAVSGTITVGMPAISKETNEPFILQANINGDLHQFYFQNSFSHTGD